MEEEIPILETITGEHLERRLNFFFPILFELLDDNKLDWNTVANKFDNKIKEYKAKHEKLKTTFEIQVSFFTLISSALNGAEDGRRLLGFIQKMFEELIELLDKNEKRLIVSNIYGILTNINSDYLNFIGELLALRHFKQSLPFQLIGTEVPLYPENPSGTKIDFQFLNTVTKKIELIEIVNVRLDDGNISNDELIDRIIHQKLKEKLLKKKISKTNRFNLVPVLWGQWDKIRVMEKYYVDRQLTINNITTPICFVPFTDQQGNPVYRTGTIDTMFTNTKVEFP